MHIGQTYCLSFYSNHRHTLCLYRRQLGCWSLEDFSKNILIACSTLGHFLQICGFFRALSFQMDMQSLLKAPELQNILFQNLEHRVRINDHWLRNSDEQNQKTLYYKKTIKISPFQLWRYFFLVLVLKIIIFTPISFLVLRLSIIKILFLSLSTFLYVYFQCKEF